MQQKRLFAYYGSHSRDDITSPDMKSNYHKLPEMYHCELDSPDPCSMYHPSHAKTKPACKSIIGTIKADISSMKENQPLKVNMTRSSTRGSARNISKSSIRLAASIKYASELDISFENKITDDDFPIYTNVSDRSAMLISPSPSKAIPSSSFRRKLYSPSDRDISVLLEAMTDVSIISPIKPSSSMYPMPTLAEAIVYESSRGRTSSSSTSSQENSATIQPKPPANKPSQVNQARRRVILHR
jgi:hypothetical protein